MNRALRAAAMGVLLLSPVALSACSAGQVAQTATQVRDKVGGSAAVGDLTIRDAQVDYPRDGVYEAGSDAPLVVAISNSGQEDDTLVGITGEGFESAELVGAPATPAPTDSDATPTSPSASPTAAPSGTGAAPTPPATTTAPSTTTGSPAGLEVTIPAQSNVFIGGDGPSVLLTGLSDEMTAGQALDVTMSFERAGDVDVRVLIGVAQRELPRGEPFDFHEEEVGGEAETQLGGGSTE